MKYLPLLPLLLLCGCTAWTTVKTTVVDYSTRMAVENLKTAEWTVCKATPVGIIRSYYSDRRIRAWEEFCREPQAKDFLK